jgi:hypothetical protein
VIDAGKHGHALGLDLGLKPIHRFLWPKDVERGSQSV